MWSKTVGMLWKTFQLGLRSLLILMTHLKFIMEILRIYLRSRVGQQTQDKRRLGIIRSGCGEDNQSGGARDLESLGYYEKAIPSLGVLCLSARPDISALWAHYAANHTGLVIQFNTKHPFFGSYVPKKKWFRDHYELFQLRPVKYAAAVPPLQATPEQTLERIIFTKGRDWSYEQEWRVCRPLYDRDRLVRRKECPNFPAYMFLLPPTAISAVIFGPRTPESRYISTIAGSVRHRHIEFYKANVDPGSYVMSITKIEWA